MVWRSCCFRCSALLLRVPFGGAVANGCRGTRPRVRRTALAERGGTGRGAPARNCLTRTLVSNGSCSRGIGTELKVGVRNEGDGLHAHAWLECGGVPVNDTVHGVHGFARMELP